VAVCANNPSMGAEEKERAPYPRRRATQTFSAGQRRAHSYGTSTSWPATSTSTRNSDSGTCHTPQASPAFSASCAP
jgi:hypothetical protein